jgi:hypothetical protein
VCTEHCECVWLQRHSADNELTAYFVNESLPLKLCHRKVPKQVTGNIVRHIFREVI